MPPHRIIEADLSELLGSCSECGPGVPIRLRRRGSRQQVMCYLAKRQSQRRYHIKHAYGLTVEEYDRLMIEQSGRCAICRRPEEPSRELHVDHDHLTHEVRGLLCFNCNAGLGKFEDDVRLLDEAAHYLRLYS